MRKKQQLQTAYEELNQKYIELYGAKQEPETSRELHVIIKQLRGYDTICVKNKITASVLANNPALQSQKEEQESHGFGMTKIKSIVTQCGGMYDIYEEDSFFCVKVFIPI